MEVEEEKGREMEVVKVLVADAERETKTMLGALQHHHPHLMAREENKGRGKTENRAKARPEPGVTVGPTSRNYRPPREQFLPHRHRGAMSSPRLAWTKVHHLATGESLTCHVPLHLSLTVLQETGTWALMKASKRFRRQSLTIILLPAPQRGSRGFQAHLLVTSLNQCPKPDHMGKTPSREPMKSMTEAVPTQAP